MQRAIFGGLLVLMAAVPASAAETEPSVAAAVASTSATVVPTRFVVSAPELRPQRPAALPVLYVSFAALQVVDARTTAGAMSRGANEVNPLLGGGTSAATFWAVKIAATASTVWSVERLWKKHPVAAVLVMAGINGGYAAVALHNARR